MAAIIFLSHIHEETTLAQIIQRSIEDEFSGFVKVFVSSDGKTIPAGANFLKRIEEGLTNCVGAIYLISPISLNRNWINFELGAVWIRNTISIKSGGPEIPVIPICHSGITPSILPMPLINLNVIQAGNSSQLELAFKSIQSAVGGSGALKTKFDTLAYSEVAREEYLAAKGGGLIIGSKVSFTAVDGKTYTGTVTQIQGEQYKVKYDNVDFDAWLTAPQFRVVQTKITAGAKMANRTPPAQANAQKQTNRIAPVSGSMKGKLYFRTMSWMNQYGTTLDLSWIFLGDNGMIVRDPKHGVNPINYQAELADNSNNVGKYSIADKALKVTWENGKTTSWSLESANGELTAIDAGIVSRPAALPNNYRISGQYAAGAFLPNVSSVQTLVFNTNGTFTQSKSGAVHNNDISAISTSDGKGTYNITGNTLRLNFENGEKLVAVIRVWDMGNGKKHLVINRSSFPQER